MKGATVLTGEQPPVSLRRSALQVSGQRTRDCRKSDANTEDSLANQEEPIDGLSVLMEGGPGRK